MATKMPGIYEIKNTVTGENYVGQSINMIGRRGSHFSLLAKGKHPNADLQESYSKHGPAAFVWNRLQFCLVDELCERETHWVSLLCPTWNDISPPKEIRRVNPRFSPTVQAIRRTRR